MKEYYSERKGLLNSDFKINLNQLREMFLSTYEYFYNKKAFECAFIGVYKKCAENTRQFLSPLMSPSPEVFFSIKLQSHRIYPIDENYKHFDESTIFSIIEILYDYVGIYNFEIDEFEREESRKEYCELFNNILKFYGDGYYLEPSNGFVMKIPNIPLQEQLKCEKEHVPDNVFERMSSAAQTFYRFDTDMEAKKKAICTLADILENIREPLKETLNQEYQINKDKHDKLIFDIVNNFNIRHDKAGQYKGYSRDIWYEWAMQYYMSVIIAYYKLDFERNSLF